ncbi:hypothetical protein [uncultured Algoriphagus sp.]|uniref:hypothetical protein n=1 Tax=uncultured Algoriphagus sp. TaxID=417365 RepID=UPI0030EF392B
MTNTIKVKRRWLWRFKPTVVKTICLVTGRNWTRMNTCSEKSKCDVEIELLLLVAKVKGVRDNSVRKMVCGRKSIFTGVE